MMFVKYIMNESVSETGEIDVDYRGYVKLIVRNVHGQEVAYSAVLVKDPDMIELVPAEIELVKERTDGIWLTYPQTLCKRIDEIADEVRTTYKIPGVKSIEIEYQQVENAVKEWRMAGSNALDVPNEISTWASLNNESIEWATSDIESMIEQFRYIIGVIRDLRLTAKKAILNANPEDIHNVYDQYKAQIKQLVQSPDAAYK